MPICLYPLSALINHSLHLPPISIWAFSLFSYLLAYFKNFSYPFVCDPLWPHSLATPVSLRKLLYRMPADSSSGNWREPSCRLPIFHLKHRDQRMIPLSLQFQHHIASALKMAVAGPCKMLVPAYSTMHHYIPQHCNLITHCLEDLKSHILLRDRSEFYPCDGECSLFGGRLEYRQCSPAIPRRQWKGNLVPGDIMGHPVSGGHKYRDLVLQVEDGCKADDLAL
jgi:hypothetical protein